MTSPTKIQLASIECHRLPNIDAMIALDSKEQTSAGKGAGRSYSGSTIISSCDGELTLEDAATDAAAAWSTACSDDHSFIEDQNLEKADEPDQDSPCTTSSEASRESKSKRCDEDSNLTKSKSLKKRVKDKMLKVMKRDEMSIEIKQKRRLSVERVTLENVFEPYTMELKAPSDHVEDVKPVTYVTGRNPGPSEGPRCVVSYRTTEEKESKGNNLDDSAYSDDSVDFVAKSCSLSQTCSLEEKDNTFSPRRCTSPPLGINVSLREKAKFKSKSFSHLSPEKLFCGEGLSLNGKVGRSLSCSRVPTRRTSDPETSTKGVFPDTTNGSDEITSRRASMTTIYLKNKLAKRKENVGISFSPSVQVMPIPRIKDYPRATRKMMWGSRLGSTYVSGVNDDEDNDLFF